MEKKMWTVFVRASVFEMNCCSESSYVVCVIETRIALSFSLNQNKTPSYLFLSCPQPALHSGSLYHCYHICIQMNKHKYSPLHAFCDACISVFLSMTNWHSSPWHILSLSQQVLIACSSPLGVKPCEIYPIHVRLSPGVGIIQALFR